MTRFIRIAALLSLGVGFNYCLDVYRVASYQPFHYLDAGHLASLGAFAFAALAGALIARHETN